MFEWVEGGVTAASGFKVSSGYAGIKPTSTKQDVVLLCGDAPLVVAGVFTRNCVKAAPVLWCQKVLKKTRSVRALFVNSGNANACTGSMGFVAVKHVVCAVAEVLGCAPQDVLVASTGVIGVPFPYEKTVLSVPGLVQGLGCSVEHAHAAAVAVMTTDLCSKEAAVRGEENGVVWTVGGMAKGSGMIHPNMATMLGFLTTDVVLGEKQAERLLKRVVDETFNTISVDGDTSTNDSVFLLCSGASGVVVPEGSACEQRVYEALKQVCGKLAEAVVMDGEGAQKLFKITVEGASGFKQASLIARAVSSSPLVKTAIAGGDPNWGRILAAAGRSGAKVRTEQLSLWIGGHCVALCGQALPENEAAAAEHLKGPRIDLLLSVGAGQGSAVALGCDLTEGYVQINAHYRS